MRHPNTILLFCLLLIGASRVNAQMTSCAYPGGNANLAQQPTTESPESITTCNSQFVVKVNVHYVLRDDGTGNFSEDSDRSSYDISQYGYPWGGQNPVLPDSTYNGYDFAKGLVWGAIIQSQQNPQMLLPQGNNTPHPAKKISYVLKGVYFHHNSALYNYDPVNITAPPSGTLVANQFNALGINKSDEVNVFIMGQNSAVPVNNAPQYRYLLGGASS